jgi:predicted Zn-dependent protease
MPIWRVTLAGEAEVDRNRVWPRRLQQLRDTLPLLPVDPYLLLKRRAWQSSNEQDRLCRTLAQVLDEIRQCAHGVDLVGFYASGPISYGYASSEGAFGWHQANSFNFDWSLFHSNGQAVKASYAGAQWDSQRFAQRMQLAREQLAFLGRPAHVLAPGQYRAYLAPAALEEVMSMLSWGGFSAQALASKASPLQKLYAGDARLSPLVSLDEQVSQSLSPAFSGEGTRARTCHWSGTARPISNWWARAARPNTACRSTARCRASPPARWQWRRARWNRPISSSNWAPGCTSATCGT